MIVDSHALAFPQTGGQSGDPSVKEHMRYVQHLLMFHRQHVRKAGDNSIAAGQLLIASDNLAEIFARR